MAAVDDTELLAEITWSQAGATSREECLDGLITMLARLVPADVVAWSHVDFANRQAVFRSEPREPYEGLGIDRLVGDADDNPMMRSYWADLMMRRGDRPPRRMSDVTSLRELKATNTYARLLHPAHAESQLTVLTHQTGLLSGSCWVFSRDEAHDFSEEDVALLARVQPVLVLIHRTGVLDLATDETTDAALLASVTAVPEPADDFELTSRELQILSLLAHGLTAAAIGRYLRISDRTVRKHLENSYRKLHCSDRLVAVDRARAAGLLPKVPFAALGRVV